MASDPTPHELAVIAGPLTNVYRAVQELCTSRQDCDWWTYHRPGVDAYLRRQRRDAPPLYFADPIYVLQMVTASLHDVPKLAQPAHGSAATGNDRDRLFAEHFRSLARRAQQGSPKCRTLWQAMLSTLRLRRLAPEPPLVITEDDAHWFNEAFQLGAFTTEPPTGNSEIVLEGAYQFNVAVHLADQLLAASTLHTGSSGACRVITAQDPEGYKLQGQVADAIDQPDFERALWELTKPPKAPPDARERYYFSLLGHSLELSGEDIDRIWATLPEAGYLDPFSRKSLRSKMRRKLGFQPKNGGGRPPRL